MNKSSRLVEIAMWNGAEDTSEDGGDDECSEKRLDENSVLDLTKSRFIDPDLAVEDFAEDIALLVLRDPGLVFVAVRPG